MTIESPPFNAFRATTEAEVLAWDSAPFGTIVFARDTKKWWVRNGGTWDEEGDQAGGGGAVDWADVQNKPTAFAPIIGGGSGDAVAGNDARLTDARTPTAHTHALAGLTQSGAVLNQVPAWNGSAWVPVTPAGGGGGMNLLRTTQNQTINAGAGVFTNITGLTFPVVNGTDYAFEFYITFQSASTGTGWRAGVNCPAGTLDFWAGSAVIANGAAGVATHTERHNTVRDDMTLLTSTIAQAVDLNVRIRGRYLCTADGTFAARFANELAANTQIVVQKGSWGWWF